MSESSRSRSKRAGEKLTTIFPIDQSILTETIKNIVLKLDDEGNLIALPVINIDPQANPNRFPGVGVVMNGSFPTANASTVVWTPAAGKRFNLIGYVIDVSSSVAEAAIDDAGIAVSDGVVVFARHACTIPALAVVTGSGGKTINVQFNGAGYHSLAVGNTLSIGIAANLTSGRISMVAWGYESL